MLAVRRVAFLKHGKTSNKMRGLSIYPYYDGVYLWALQNNIFHIVIFQFRGCFNKFVLGQPQSEWISVLKGLSESIENRVCHVTGFFSGLSIFVSHGTCHNWRHIPPFQTDPKKGLQMVERSLSTRWPNKNASSTVRKGVQRCICDLAQWSGQNVTEFKN